MKYIIGMCLIVSFGIMALAGLLIWLLLSIYSKGKEKHRNDENKDWAFWIFSAITCLASFILFLLYWSLPALININSYGH